MPVKLEDMPKAALIRLIRGGHIIRLYQTDLVQAMNEILLAQADEIFKRQQEAGERRRAALIKSDMKEYYRHAAEAERLWQQWESIHHKIDRLWEELERPKKEA